MSNSCVFCPKARNKKTGEESPSKFFMDLLGYSSNDRKFAKENYVVGTNDEFRAKYESQLKFDENDEPTIDSYLKVSEREVNKENRKKQLNKQLGSGTYDYDTALSKKQSFESQADDSTNENYTPVLTPESGLRVRVEMQENTADNRATTVETITNKELFDRIRAAVNALGGDPTFINERYSQYSTKNAERLLNGYLGIIQLSTQGNITANFAHEAGHFAVGALGTDNALIKRLENSLSKEVIAKLMPDEIENIRRASNPTREAMGALVGKYILDEVDKKSGLSRLLDRVVTAAKKIFYKATRNDAGYMRAEAQAVAEKIAYNFMTQQDNGTLENALKSDKEPLYKRMDKQAADIFEEMYKTMNIFARQIGAINKRHESDIEKKMGAISKGVLTLDDAGNPIAGSLSETAITQTLGYLQELLDPENSIRKRLEAVSLSPNKYTQSAASLRELDTICQTTDAIIKSLERLLEEAKPTFSGTKTYTITDSSLISAWGNAVNTLRELNAAARTAASIKRKEFILSFMEGAYGKEYIYRAARKVFSVENGFLRLVHREGTSQDIEYYLNELREDEQFGSIFINMSNSKDIINQIMYIAAQEYKEAANQAVLRTWDDVRLLREFAKKNNIDTKDLFERAWSNKERKEVITGNYISSANWGEWENALQEERDKIKEDFAQECINKLGKEPNQIPQMVRSFMYAKFAKDRIKQWHKDNSYFDSNAGRWVPFDGQIDDHGRKRNYHNPKYDELFVADPYHDTQEEIKKKGNRKKLLDGLLKIKNEQDQLLTQANWDKGGYEYAVQINPYRMPQFRGRVTDEMSNIWDNTNARHKTKGLLRGLRHRLTNWFTIHATDSDWGGNNPLDAKDEYIDGSIKKDVMHIHKIATYGIKKLEDMNELSTDVFSSLLQYSSMANNYSVFYSLSNILETGRTQLLERKVGDKIEKEGPRSKAFTTYESFLKYQVYNDYEQITAKNINITKFLNSLSGVISKLYLAGNVGGAIVNTGTGCVELFKEGFAGSEFSMTELLAAEATYLSVLPKNLWGSGKQYKEDKLALFTKEFNIGDRGVEAVKNYNTRLDSWIGNRLNQLPGIGNGNSMWVYSSGDHFMQSISYITAAKKMQIQLVGGKTVSLWEALVPVEIEENGVKVKKLDFNPKLNYALNSKGHHMFTMKTLDRDGNEVTRNASFEQDGKTLLMNKCREINNRMHGVYNKMDKSQFQSVWYGKLISVMKGYVYGKVASEMLTERYSIALGREVEGKMTTASKVAWEILGDAGTLHIGDALSAIYATALPFDFMGSKKIYRKLGFNVEQYRNIRRMWLALVIAKLLAMLGRMTLDWLLDESPKEKMEREKLESMSKAEKKEYLKKKHEMQEEDLKELKKEIKSQLKAEGVPKYKLDDMAEIEALYELGLKDRAKRLSYKVDIEEDLRGETGRIKLSDEDKEIVKAEMDKYDARVKEQGLNKYTFMQGVAGLFGYYSAIRMEREQEGYLFVTPIEAIKEIRSVAQITPLVVNAGYEAVNFIKDVQSGEQVDRGSYYGYDRWQKDIISKTPYWKSLHILKDPIKAEEAWEYSRGRK